MLELICYKLLFDYLLVWWGDIFEEWMLFVILGWKRVWIELDMYVF